MHNKQFGKNQERLLKKIIKANPNVIVITGDLIDRRKYNLEAAMIVSRGLGDSIVPIRIFNRLEIVVVTLNIG